ncbi:hypothetical protein KY318_00140, partial [Candidatus Woesearchaeota archaeon]|nr:hypothetical protein [Candidatus Woesearchaeota archaeon]
MHSKIKKGWIVVWLLVGLISLALVPVVRWHTQAPLIHSTEGFHNLRAAELLNEPSSLGFIIGRTNPNLYHYALSLLLRVFDNINAVVWFHVVLGLVLVGSAWYTLMKLNLSPKLVSISLGLLIVSPSFVYLFTQPIPAGFGLAMAALGLALLLSPNIEKLWCRLIAALVLILSIGSGLLFLVSALIIVLGVLNLRKFKGFVATVMASATIIFYLLGYHRAIHLALSHPAAIINAIVFDFGGRSGFGFGTLVLGVIGVLFTWKSHKALTTVYLILIAAVLGLFMLNDLSALSLFSVLYVFAGYMVIKLLQHKWVLPALKLTTLILVCFSFGFSWMNSITIGIAASPTPSEGQAIEWLGNVKGEGSVLSAPTYAPIIQALAHRECFPDPWLNSNTAFNRTLSLL